MQSDPVYGDVIAEIRGFFKERISRAQKSGIDRDSIIIDPGIGFGKRLSHNMALIKHLDSFQSLGVPLMVGVSRKSFIADILNVPVEERLEGTIASSLISVFNGANILRVHDVRAVRKAVRVAESILNSEYVPQNQEGNEGETRHVL